MVQLVVKVETAEGGIPEWMLIEMQGQLECHGEEQLAGNFIGDLHFTKKGIPIIIIGHHILYGKVVSLDRPYIVLIKNSTSGQVSMETDRESSQIPASKEVAASDCGIHFKVSAAIRRKIVFKTRPKPIITYVPKKVL